MPATSTTTTTSPPHLRRRRRSPPCPHACDVDDDHPLAPTLRPPLLPVDLPLPMGRGRHRVPKASCTNYTQGLCSEEKRWYNMVGPGSRNSKRVRLPTHSIQRVAIRSSKRQCAMEQTHDEVEDELPPVIENDGVGEQELPRGNTSRPPSPVMDWSYQADVSHASQEGLNQSEQNLNEENEGTTNKTQRRSRPVTRGVLLNNMTRAMGKRLPISVAEGKVRPHARCKLPNLHPKLVSLYGPTYPSSHTGRITKEMKILELFEEFKGRLARRLAIDTKDNPTIEAYKCIQVQYTSDAVQVKEALL